MPLDTAAESSLPGSGTGDDAASGAAVKQVLTGEDLSGRDMRGMDLRGADMSGTNLSGADLSGANLESATLLRANLTGAKLLGTNLNGAELFEATLDEADLLGAKLIGANLTNVSAVQTSFGGADLSQSRLFAARCTSATFSGATLSGADLRTAIVRAARFVGSVLDGADMRAADAMGADLTASHLTSTCLDECNLREARLDRIRHFSKSTWIDADTHLAQFSGALTLRRFIADDNYLYELRTRDRMGAIIYWAWYLTSDCGRSIARWGMLTALVALLYAWVYTTVGVDYGDYETVLSPIYYSIVTMTSLGYGDVLPQTASAQFVAMSQAVVGYCLLGGLISILSNKIARRAD